MRSWTAKAPTTSDPALRALLCVAPGDDVRDDAAFPAGRTDANADLSEQLDLRRDNSWTQKIDQISTPELAEVFAINALAPFVINSKLIPVLKDGASNERRRFVVNVSRRWRASSTRYTSSRRHPHTNMAKAAEHDDADVRGGSGEGCVFMTAVDTGWINDEKPTGRAVEHARRHAPDATRRNRRGRADPDPVLGGHELPLHGISCRHAARASGEWGLCVLCGFCAGFSSKFFVARAGLLRRYARGTRVYVPQTRRDAQRSRDRAEALQKKRDLAKQSPRGRETNMNLGDEHMTDETRDIYRAKVAERQAAEDALVQKRIEAASDYVGTRVETNR